MKEYKNITTAPKELFSTEGLENILNTHAKQYWKAVSVCTHNSVLNIVLERDKNY